MERLTNKNLTRACNDPGDYCGLDSVCKRDCHKPAPCKIPGIVHRLAEIEDILGDDYDLGRLRELVEADRDGRCVALPKDGMVYYIEEAGGEKWVANKPIQQITVKCGWGIASMDFSLLDTGKYFTREAAEAALKGEQDG